MGAGPLWELDPGETGPLGSGIPGEQDTCESKIPRNTRGSKALRSGTCVSRTPGSGTPEEWDMWEQEPQ